MPRKWNETGIDGTGRKTSQAKRQLGLADLARSPCRRARLRTCLSEKDALAAEAVA
ncbi:MAG: hypothetical protein LBU32_00470 [Clostridiales bacterium]|nr:hypothetical protein [Clostridiales bacterium]